MTWRTVTVSSHSKIDYHLGYLVVRGETVKRVHISEISILIIENTAVSLTAYLVNELIKNNVKLIFCDEKRNPVAEVAGLYGGHDSSDMVRRQIDISSTVKESVWQQVITSKIKNQLAVLNYFECPNQDLLEQYAKDVETGDKTNREGHAAKVYFNSLFGKSFYRSSDCAINAGLNYGYSILLSAVNREIVGYGCLTQLGIFHNNCDNQFNLGCDLMEPFRPMVDYLVKTHVDYDGLFAKEQKQKVLQLLQCKIMIGGRRETLQNAIRLFVYSSLDALLEEKAEIKLPEIDFSENVL